MKKFGRGMCVGCWVDEADQDVFFDIFITDWSDHPCAFGVQKHR